MASSTRGEILDPSFRVEEEMVRGYKAEHYYPVRIGDMFQKRYKVVGKLGYGSASTVWLCRDTQASEAFVALKVYINSSKRHRELPIYEHINSLGSDLSGRAHIRDLLDSFEISGPHGKHICLVHEALGKNLEELRDVIPERVFEPDLVRHTLRDILRALHFLHTDAGIIHTDIQPNNILLGVRDNSMFKRFEQDELENPMPRKELPGRTIYCSRPMRITRGAPALCDFSEARFVGPHNRGRVMPAVYRAPEVILDMPWGCPIDIWGFAMTVSFSACTISTSWPDHRFKSCGIYLSQSDWFLLRGKTVSTQSNTI
ncbi:hypothetical protein LTR86_002465 [Recurvomyces mirabilis]|nr:hypothetical protein LTR86_002465 [Recurvomyces mirabilis]